MSQAIPVSVVHEDGTVASVLPLASSNHSNDYSISTLSVRLKELLRVKKDSRNGEVYRFKSAHRQAIDMLRDDLRRELGLCKGGRLPDDVNANALEAVHAFTRTVFNRVIEEGYEVRTLSVAQGFMQFSGDGELKESGLQARMRATREFVTDGQRFIAADVTAIKLEKLLSNLHESGSKQWKAAATREGGVNHAIRVAELKLKQCNAIRETLAHHEKRDIETKYANQQK